VGCVKACAWYEGGGRETCSCLGSIHVLIVYRLRSFQMMGLVRGDSERGGSDLEMLEIERFGELILGVYMVTKVQGRL
jgi:hypothetical protein